MLRYNRLLDHYVDMDDIDKQASREGNALHTQAQNRINKRHTVNKHKQRFTKSKWIGDKL